MSAKVLYTALYGQWVQSRFAKTRFAETLTLANPNPNRNPNP